MPQASTTHREARYAPKKSPLKRGLAGDRAQWIMVRIHHKGDTVVSTKNIGGFMRPSLPKGTKGVVVRSSGFTQQARVLFTIESFWGRKKGGSERD